MPFEKGQSGNPAGRRQGSRNKVTLAIEEMLDGEAEVLTRKVIDLAKAGDMVALRLCLDRIFPSRKDRPVTFTLPTLDSAADAAKSSAIVVQAVASGDLTPSEAADLSKVLESFARTLEAADFEKRLAKLEQVIENRKSHIK